MQVQSKSQFAINDNNIQCMQHNG